MSYRKSCDAPRAHWRYAVPFLQCDILALHWEETTLAEFQAYVVSVYLLTQRRRCSSFLGNVASYVP